MFGRFRRKYGQEDEEFEVAVDRLEGRMKKGRVGNDFEWQATPTFRSDFLEDKRGGMSTKKLLYGGTAALVIGAIGAIGYHGWKKGWFGNGGNGEEPSKYKVLEKTDTNGDGIMDLFKYNKDGGIMVYNDRDGDGKPDYYEQNWDTRITVKKNPDGSIASAKIEREGTELDINHNSLVQAYEIDFSKMPIPSKMEDVTKILEGNEQSTYVKTILATNMGKENKTQVMDWVPEKYRQSFGNITYHTYQPITAEKDYGCIIWNLDLKPGETGNVTYSMPIPKLDISPEKTLEALERDFNSTAKNFGAKPMLMEERHYPDGSVWKWDINGDAVAERDGVGVEMSFATAPELEKCGYSLNFYNEIDKTHVYYSRSSEGTQAWRIVKDGIEKSAIVDVNGDGIIDDRYKREGNVELFLTDEDPPGSGILDGVYRKAIKFNIGDRYIEAQDLTNDGAFERITITDLAEQKQYQFFDNDKDGTLDYMRVYKRNTEEILEEGPIDWSYLKEWLEYLESSKSTSQD